MAGEQPVTGHCSVSADVEVRQRWEARSAPSAVCEEGLTCDEARLVGERLSFEITGRDGLIEDVLDRIDEIVPPGTEINPADNYQAAPPALLDRRLRRR